MMNKKQANGNMNDIFTAGMPQMISWSIIKPCKGGISAPPTIAITKKAAPRWVSFVSTFSRAIP